ncbi:hypothetical protein [Wolinella succinogenes]|uniref:ALLOPHANATE HYDROLASE n=1 Tax=Wolinella succinogenes (strain ATCC 29543 / DSM 1740 / CCUG 13145 / JCM 31913 / LMG 7466 / NCTC 11488 / FDC 602W) TaxID=273121 RepID=Q7M983_WOLSU|nr:hypothetical protein [Wolinella succinogenes]NLU34512.1 hypothetical protein [Wolinella succinogenes]CAE10210.1 ALLOPHANATE HYDROLASE [Wolinella succinogenes]VEG82425.1 allophanate hydrolase [Wolinella succinogenes]HCZ18255.1 hypothetical protein [Helicobacter sp.]
MKKIEIAVCGAHMRGLPLNHQLLALGGEFLREAKTLATYRLYVVPHKEPARPGLVRDGSSKGEIELEVWALPIENFGAFMTQIASPLCLGTLWLEGGERVCGFLCESEGVKGAQEITSFGGWRHYLASL